MSSVARLITIEHYLPGLLPHDKEKELDHSSDALLRMRNSLLNMDVSLPNNLRARLKLDHTRASA